MADPGTKAVMDILCLYKSDKAMRKRIFRAFILLLITVKYDIGWFNNLSMI